MATPRPDRAYAPHATESGEPKICLPRSAVKQPAMWEVSEAIVAHHPVEPSAALNDSITPMASNGVYSGPP